MGQGKIFSDVRDSAGKMAETAARMAALFHYVQGHQGDISQQTFEQAREICTWHLYEFKRIFGNEGQLTPEMVDANLLETWLIKEWQRNQTTYIGVKHILQYGPPSLRTKAKRDIALLTLQRLSRVAIFTYGKSDYVQLTQYAAYSGPPVVNKFTTTVPNGAINGAVSGYPALP